MKNIVIIMAIIFFPLYPIWGQNEQKEINTIKSNKNYLYATGTSTLNADDALNMANDLLRLEIEQWLKENTKDDISGYIAKLKESHQQIITQRGKLFRIFTYVKKKDIFPYYHEEDLMVVDLAKKLKVVNNSDNNKKELNRTEELITLNDMENNLLTLKSFSLLNNYLVQGIENGIITEKGKYINMPKSGTFYLFVYNTEGEIPACLKVIDTKFINLLTKKSDSLSNYKGCGAIWFKTVDTK